ncbi:hypothetical protein [Hubei hepe-like virus 2]|uniref:hypothetical protein n=1 Tax=Hubei hepe-like virus 2 TaxID=1922895 RepID=UPI00090BF70D|nr:hypothetical protein [Hubei hepe-like virus 2]APG77747.1 hypothetical protein [Hubei hepe-like virus 2]
MIMNMSEEIRKKELSIIDADRCCPICNTELSRDITARENHIRKHNNTGGGAVFTDVTSPIAFDDIKVDEELWKNQPIEKNYTGRVAEKLLSCFNAHDLKSKITEISYAPGHFAKIADDAKLDYHGYHYIGQNALEINYKCLNHYEFDDINNLTVTTDVLLIDIGDENTFEKISCNYFELINRSECKKAIIKIFAFKQEACRKLTNQLNSISSNVIINKPITSRKRNSECYLIMTKGKPNVLGVDITSTMEEILNPSREEDINLYTFTVTHAMIKNYEASLSKDMPIHKDIIQYMADMDAKDDFTMSVAIMSGCAGCGKTKKIKLTKKDCYVAPLKRVKDQFVVEGGKTYTHDVFLNKLIGGHTFDRVFIDEYTLLPKGYYGMLSNFPINTITLLGDPYQLKLKDFNKCFTLADILSEKFPWTMTKTNRFGKMTCKLLNNIMKDYFPCDISSDKDDKVTFDTYRTMEQMVNACTRKQFQFITLEQKHKEDFKKFPNLITTIHESQGSTYEKVMLYVTGDNIKNNLIEDYEYTYVGMSRHKNELKIVTLENDEVAVRHLNYLGSMIDVQLNLASISTFSDTHIVPKKDIFDNPIDLVADNYTVDIGQVEEILTKHGFAGEDGVIIEARDATLPNVPKFNFAGQRNKAKFRMTNGYVIQKRIQKYGSRLAKRSYVRYYNMKDRLKTGQTGISRYLQYADHRRPKAFGLLLDPIKILQKGFLKFTKFNTVEEYYAYCSPNVEDLTYHAHEYLKSLNQKNFDSKTWAQLEHLETDFKRSIDFFMKEQPKFQARPIKGACVYGPGETRFHIMDLVDSMRRQEEDQHPLPYNETYKAGQGVSSGSKQQTLLFAAYTRHINQKLNDCMATVESKGFEAVYATNESDANIGLKFAKGCGQSVMRNDAKHLCTDFSEHDTSHSYIVLLWKCLDFIGMGFDLRLVQSFFDAYATWRQSAKFEGQNFTIYNDLMQHSGSADTIHGNSKLTMGANGACFEFKGIKFAGFKGDDTDVFAKSYTKLKCWHYGTLSKLSREMNKDVAELFGFNLKIDESPVGEFICNFVVPHGFFPDIIRRTARIISTIHASEAKFNEAKLNLAECLTVVSSQDALNTGIEYAREYYNYNGINISSDEIYTLWKYCENIVRDSKLGPPETYNIETFDTADVITDNIQCQNKYM